MKTLTDQHGHVWYVPCTWNPKHQPQLYKGQKAQRRFSGISLEPVLLRRNPLAPKAKLPPAPKRKRQKCPIELAKLTLTETLVNIKSSKNSPGLIVDNLSEKIKLLMLT